MSQNEPDRADVQGRLDKMLADLAEVRRKTAELQQTEAEIEETRREIEERKAQIEGVREEIREKAATVDALHAEAVRARARVTETRQKAEEVTARIEASTKRREAIDIPAPDILDKIGAGVTALEKPFADVSRGLRRKAEEIREGGDRSFDPSERYTSAARARRAPQGIREGTGLALRAGASAFDAFTMPVRPVLMGETIVTTAKLVVDAPTRKAFLRSAAEDPAGFGADILGGVVGGYALGYGVGRVRRYYTSKKYLLDVPDEMFLVPEEAAFSYPQPETGTRTSTHAFLKKVRETGVVDDFDTYRGPITFDKQLKGFRRTGHDLISELVPDQAPMSSIYRPGVTKFIETVETFRPGVRRLFRPDVTPRAPLAFTTGLGILSSLKPPKEIADPSELVDVVVEEAVRIMPDYSTRRRTRPKPTEPGFIEAPTIIEIGETEERERDWIAPMFRPPRHVQRRRQRRTTIMDVTVDVAQREIETPPALLFSWPTAYTRPRDPTPVYRPRMAKDALRRGRGSWRWFGEFRQYLKGDPLKVLEGL